jgi:hypothetical protein
VKNHIFDRIVLFIESDSLMELHHYIRLTNRLRNLLSILNPPTFDLLLMLDNLSTALYQTKTLPHVISIAPTLG